MELNARYRYKKIVKLLCELLAHRKSLSRIAIDNGVYYTTLCRRVSRISGRKIGRGIGRIAVRIIRSGYSIIDFTYLRYFGKLLLS